MGNLNRDYPAPFSSEFHILRKPPTLLHFKALSRSSNYRSSTYICVWYDFLVVNDDDEGRRKASFIFSASDTLPHSLEDERTEEERETSTLLFPLTHFDAQYSRRVRLSPPLLFFGDNSFSWRGCDEEVKERKGD